jgi:hypothetical protein
MIHRMQGMHLCDVEDGCEMANNLGKKKSLTLPTFAILLEAE